MYPAIKPMRLTGEEHFLFPDGTDNNTLKGFWQWAYSDLVGNSERGALAEYIVACALGVNQTVRVSWDKYDLLSKDGITIEVKTSGYIQTWEQKSLSKLIFGIQPTYGWDSESNEYDEIQKRQSEIYVFCVHKHTEQETINPLDISQWDFYLLPTKLINSKFQSQKTATLSALIKAGAELCEYCNLSQRITQLCR